MSVDPIRLTGAVLFALATLQQRGVAQSPVVADVAARARCNACHTMDLIVQQRLTRAGWEREVDKMIRWGATVGEADRPALIDYLERSTSSTLSREDDSRGAEILRARCLSCHSSDIVEQQRLTSAAWRREVDKMTAWGAKIDAVERDSLVAYLAQRFGTR